MVPVESQPDLPRPDVPDVSNDPMAPNVERLVKASLVRYHYTYLCFPRLL